jgi:hypothetical protein
MPIMVDHHGRDWFLGPFLDIHNPAVTVGAPQLFYRTNVLKCSDERDRIYAVAPLTGISLTELHISPDYDGHVWDVYCDFVPRYIEFTSDLGIITTLSWCSTSEPANDKPSWVPSFLSPAKTKFVGPRGASGHLAPDWSYLGDDILRIAGVYCATVNEVEPVSMPSNDRQSVESEVSRLAPQNLRHGTYLTGCSVMEAFAATCGFRWSRRVVGAHFNQ